MQNGRSHKEGMGQKVALLKKVAPIVPYLLYHKRGIEWRNSA